MKANELMVGDWFQFKISKYPYKRGELINIKTHYEIALCDRLCGIPITSEILEKNGFVYRDIPFEMYWEYDGLIINRGAYYYINLGNNLGMDVSNVHQLQHALRLCGLNDLADNFKI